MAAPTNQATAFQLRQPERHCTTGASDPDENDRIVREYLPQVKLMAQRLVPGSDAMGMTEDLVSAGVLGLLEAMGRYDASKGAKIFTFAYLRIKGAMVDELRKRDWLPRSLRAKVKKMERAAHELESRLGHQPDDEEMAEELGIDSSDYRGQAREIRNLSVVSVEEVEELAGAEADGSIGRTSEGDLTPEDYAEANEELAAAAREISTLPERERRVLRLYFYEDMSIREIAARFGLTESRISQIRSQGLARIRKAIAKRA